MKYLRIETVLYIHKFSKSNMYETNFSCANFQEHIPFVFLYIVFSKKGKKTPKVDRDDVLKEAIANSVLWASRLGATEASKNEYR